LLTHGMAHKQLLLAIIGLLLHSQSKQVMDGDQTSVLHVLTDFTLALEVLALHAQLTLLHAQFLMVFFLTLAELVILDNGPAVFHHAWPAQETLHHVQE